MNLKSHIKKFLPSRVTSALGFLYRKARIGAAFPLIFIYDALCFVRHGGVFGKNSKGVLEAALIKGYHSVEKGLALPNPRPGFGQDSIAVLLTMTDKFLTQHGPNAVTQTVINSLQEYTVFNEKNGQSLPKLKAQIQVLKDKQKGLFPHSEGGTIEIEKKAILEAIKIDFRKFLDCRYSVRHYTDESVPMKIIEQAADMARKTPSVCNRQSGCVFVVADRQKMKPLLALQNGNRGFCDGIDKLLIVTSRLNTFLSFEERNQPWVDGGMFAMTLVYALHALGVGSCCLNWDVLPSTDRKMKRLAGIPKDHAVIMMLAVGNLPEKLLVAQSPRRPLEEILFSGLRPAPLNNPNPIVS